MCDCDGVVLPQGPAGAAGAAGANGSNGLNSFTKTTAGFAMPLVGSNVTISVSTSGQMSPAWAVAGQPAWVESAGAFEVVSSTSNSITLKNLGGTTNAAPAANISATGLGVSPSGLAGVAGVGTNGVAVLDHDLSINNTTSAAYAVVKTLGVVANTIGTVDDAIKLSFDVIGDRDPTAVPVYYDIRVQFDGNTMLELDNMIASAQSSAGVSIEIDLVVTAADTITPYVKYEFAKSATRLTQFLLSGGATAIRYVDQAAVAAIVLSSGTKNITIELKSNGTKNVSMTYFQALKLKK